jgi:uncharacterized protein
MTDAPKLKKLKKNLTAMEKVLVAFSGGCDSTFLLKMAKDCLGKENVLAVTADSPTYPCSEKEDARRLAGKIGARHRLIRTQETQDSNFFQNPKERCYYCKRHLFLKLKDIAIKEKFSWVIDATNADDAKDYRPGAVALKELGIRSPLKEAGITKKQIREFSKKVKLPSWNKPAMACLASRIPYGERIIKDNLKMVEQAEDFLKKMGFCGARVRHHKNMARIELPKGAERRLLTPAVTKKVLVRFKKIGYNYISLDLEGYRMGSMNEVLKR